MPSRPSSFETLIEDLLSNTEVDAEAPKPQPLMSIDGLEAAWELAAHVRGASSRPNAHDNTGALQRYDNQDADIERRTALDPARIMSELGLRPGASESDIAALKREFALRNHPDRVPDDLRSIATERMMIANNLIDRHALALQKAKS